MTDPSAARKAAEEILEYTGLELPRTRDGIQAIIERHFPERLQVISESAAACQTVAPPTEYPMTYLWYTLMRGELMRVVPELSEGGDVQKLAMAELRCAEKMLAALSGNSTGAAPAVSTPNSNPEDEFTPKGRVIPDLRKREHLCEWQAVSTPRCPLCGSTELTLYVHEGEVYVHCSETQTHGAIPVETGADFAQFFNPAPSPPRPKIICLCGSTRFIEQFAIQTWELELKGNIVLGCTLLPSWYCPVRDHFAESLGVKEQRDNHHLQKIDLADEVLVLNVGGYIGESTRREIEYAQKTGKPVRYLEGAAPYPQGESK